MQNSIQTARSITEEIRIGSLAVEMGLLAGESLIECIHSWTQQRSQSFLEILIANSGLESDDVSLVEALLDERRKSGSTARPSQETDGPAELDIFFQSDQPGNWTERFQTDRFLARGGLGVVFQGHDRELDRTVAIKELDAEYAKDPWAAERFHRESALTASLEHPSIVPIYGRGVRPDGTPFYAMRMIAGRTLREVADQVHQAKKQGIATDRMEFRKLIGQLIPVSQAIEHAHSRGVIHRDLKPSNVIVGEHGETMLIDWGLARKITAEENETNKNDERASHVPDHELTLQGTALGTLAYMSPEQARGEKTLTAATDIFGLGGILFYLLTGFPPRGGEDKKLQAEQASTGYIDDKLLQSPQVPRQLSAICRKALSSQPDERYISAASFARDLENYLAEEPVSAYQESMITKLRRWARAHQALVTGAITTLIISLTAMGISLYVLAGKNEMLREAIAVAQVEATEKEKARAAEETAKQQVASQLQQIELVNDTVFDIFSEFDIQKVKEAGDPVESVLAKKLIAAGKKLDEKAITNGQSLAKVRNRLGQTLLSLGYPKDAIPLFELARQFRVESLGAENEHTLASMSSLAVGYYADGKLDLALPLFEESLKLTSTKFGTDHPETLNCMNSLAECYRAAGKLDLALPLFEESFKLRKANLGNENPSTLISMHNLANAYKSAGKLDLALPLLEEALMLFKTELGSDHPNTINSMNSLAEGYRTAGKFDLALPLHEEALNLRKAKLGLAHPQTLISMHNLALGYRDTGKLDLALPLLEETLQLMQTKLGPDHPSTLSSMNSLAAAYSSEKKFDQAISLFEETLRLKEKKLGRSHPGTQLTVANLGDNYLNAGRIQEAIPLLEEAYHASANQPMLRGISGPLLESYVKGNRKAEAVALVTKLLDESRAKHPPGSPLLAAVLAEFGSTLLDLGQFGVAESLLRECVDIREKTQPDAWNTFNARVLLGGALVGLAKEEKDETARTNRFAEAEPLLVQGYEGLKTREKTIPPQGVKLIPQALDRLIDFYTETGKPDEVKKWQADRERSPPPAESLPLQSK